MDEPKTREENYLARMAGNEDIPILDPVTRKEHYYKEIIENFESGGGGGGTDNVMIIPNISFADANAETTANLALQGVNEGKAVIGMRPRTGGMDYYFLTGAGVEGITFVELVGYSNQAFQNRLFVDGYSYDSSTKKFAHFIVSKRLALADEIPYTETMPGTPTPEELRNNYTPVQHPLDSQQIYVPKVIGLPDMTPGDENKVPVVNESDGNWQAQLIKKAEIDLSSMSATIQAFVMMAYQSGSATFYSQDTDKAWFLISAIQTQVNSVTGVFPVLSFGGDLKAQVISVGTGYVSAFGTFYDSENSKFVKMYMSALIEEDSQENIVGYVIFNCEAADALNADA